LETSARTDPWSRTRRRPTPGSSPDLVVDGGFHSVLIAPITRAPSSSGCCWWPIGPAARPSPTKT
jgi:hypothetical protein